MCLIAAQKMKRLHHKQPFQSYIRCAILYILWIHVYTYNILDLNALITEFDEHSLICRRDTKV